MQKSFVAITLALTLTCTFAYTSINQTAYVKAPVQVVFDNETTYTNASALLLASVNSGELDLVAVNVSNSTTNGSNTSNGSNGSNSSNSSNATNESNTTNTTNESNTTNTTNTTNGSNTTNSTNTSVVYKWNSAYRKLDGKALTGNSNSNVTVSGSNKKSVLIYANGYAVTISNETDANGTQQLAVYQSPVTGAAPLAKILISSNNNSTWTPEVVTYAVISKNVYVFYLTSATQVNVTSFTIGGANKGSLEFNLTTSYNGSLSVVWGEALGSNQLYANWMDGTVLKYSTIDVTKGTVNATAVAGWTADFRCVAYSTDKKWFGDLCRVLNTTTTNTTDNTTNTTTTVNTTVANYYVRSNTSALIFLTNTTTNVSNYVVYPYGPYIAVVFIDITNTTAFAYSYGLYNLDSYTTFRAPATFITTNEYFQIYRVVSGGLYTLTANTTTEANGTVVNYHNVSVGLVLGSSYLASVLGFIMTIVAGVLLF